MPLRRAALLNGPDMRLYRRMSYGRLTDFNVLDGRQYRSRQADTQAERDDPSRTMLGAQQERWPADGLGASTRTWKVLAQQTVMARADRDPGPGLSLSDDHWSGYEHARQRTFDAVAERGVDNFVVITGDAHCSMVADLKLNFDDQNSPTIGAEFLGTSIASGGDGADMDGPAADSYMSPPAAPHP
ncbi:alkaline phosphatase D family protein [Streptomyces acidicola]|uniref:PhoD-like phosphatase metallophosphatase domain-containing protein n=1 Tax=Streptomyces acidicola TaxID=2596892 RepID=A0A5N8X255_9ACTN|nr:alkaline phosphatase D family protein [Streptomyces acidicola]MPY53673.1 hypothetical protein [Streptomyces acidicola]